ncbi:hypothetical protein [Streptomyces mirabilis]|uniref:hypothetical protein n=1 Tax=Streptomyces mirabilis TaxID=68239 RepID=UPI0036DBB53B
MRASSSRSSRCADRNAVVAVPSPFTRAHPVGADVVMKTFSKVLTEDRTVEDGRTRLLQQLAKQHVTPARQKDGARPRPLTAIAEALGHRALAPTLAISPSRPDHDHRSRDQPRRAKAWLGEHCIPGTR